MGPKPVVMSIALIAGLVMAGADDAKAQRLTSFEQTGVDEVFDRQVKDFLFPELTLPAPKGPLQDDIGQLHLNLICRGAVYREGKPVRGAKLRHTAYGIDQQGRMRFLGRGTRRTGRTGQTRPLTFRELLDDAAQQWVVVTEGRGRRMADRAESECQITSFAPCPASECFAKRFQLRCLPDNFFHNSPNEIENGFDERWTVAVENRCSKGGTYNFTLNRTVGNGGVFPEGVVIHDTATGFSLDPEALLNGGGRPGTVVPWPHPGACLIPD